MAVLRWLAMVPDQRSVVLRSQKLKRSLGGRGQSAINQQQGRLMESKHDRSPLPTGQQSGPTEMAVFWWLAAVGAIVTAVSAGYIAHCEFGFSRYEIRTPALMGAAIIGLLMATEYVGQKLQKSKSNKRRGLSPLE